MDNKTLKRIETEVNKYLKKDPNLTNEQVLNLYGFAAIDEGYRFAVNEMLEHEYVTQNKKLKRRKFNCFHYVDKEDLEQAAKFAKVIFDDKEIEGSLEEEFKKNNEKYTESAFILYSVIHGSFDVGYNKANSIEEIAKWVCNDENVDIVVELMNELLVRHPEIADNV